MKEYFYKINRYVYDLSLYQISLTSFFITTEIKTNTNVIFSLDLYGREILSVVLKNILGLKRGWEGENNEGRHDWCSMRNIIVVGNPRRT
jgi:hypothetical protein